MDGNSFDSNRRILLLFSADSFTGTCYVKTLLVLDSIFEAKSVFVLSEVNSYSFLLLPIYVLIYIYFCKFIKDKMKQAHPK